MGTEPKSGRLRKKCARLGLCSMHTEPCQYTVWWFLFPPPLPSLFIFTLSSLSRKNSPLSQLPGYIHSVRTWGPGASWNHVLKRGLPSTGTPGARSEQLQDRIKGHQKIGVLSLQEDQRGENWEVSLKEACRSCIQYDAWLRNFPDPQKVTL